MTNLRSYSFCTLLACCGLLLAGCGGEIDYREFSEQDRKPADEHSHDDHDHHHHGEEHKAPHGGHLRELGEHAYHAEFVFDDDAHSITVYLLDKEAEKGVSIDAEELVLKLSITAQMNSFPLAAQPQEDDPEGQSSRFVSTDEGLFERFEDDKQLAGLIDVTIAEKSYRIIVTRVSDHSHP